LKIPVLPIAIIACLTIAAAPVNAQRSKKSTKKPVKVSKAVAYKGGESTLVGVGLYDPGLKLIRMFGSPDEIQAVSIGGGSGGGGGFGGGGGAAGGPSGAPVGGPAGMGGAAKAPGADWNAPFEPFTDFQMGDPEARGRGGQGGPPGYSGPGGPPSNIPGVPGGPGGRAGGGSRMGGPSGPGGLGNTASTERATFTRWVYRRPTSRYAFILDKFNKVVQIEVVGLNDAKCRTKRGIQLGATFGQIMTKYDQPDGYDIAGDSLVVRFLVHGKVAFRLARLEPNKPHRVTGIVVAAGKA
jgi:hypothetical protein